MTQAGKQVYLVANWKSNKTLDEAGQFIDQYEANSTGTVIICPPFPYLVPLKEKAAKKRVKLGAQDVSSFPFGAYTGAVSADMLKGLVEYVIVGHSERRRYFHETNEMVASKARLAIDTEITPIVCVDEPYLEAQLAFFERNEFNKMIIAYEPLAAIGSGHPDTPETAEKMAERINQLTQVATPVIYGGSVNETNVGSFVAQNQIAGVLVGGASLNPKQWQAIVQAVG